MVSVGGALGGKRLPSRVEYDDALANPARSFRSKVLRDANFLLGRAKYPRFIHASGSFAVVARARFEGREWAVRLPVRAIDGAVDHYRALPALLGRLGAFALGVRVFDSEIRVDEGADTRFPVVAVEWFNGDQLSRFVRTACERRDLGALRSLRTELRRLAALLVDLEVSHGDVTGENILVRRGANGGVSVKLIDYDSMWSVQEPFRSRLSPVGVNELHHPQLGNPIGPHADKVAFLLMDIAVGVLIAHPSVGMSEDLFDGRRFVFTATEVLRDGSDLLNRVPPEDQETLADLKSYLARGVASPPSGWWSGGAASAPDNGRSIREISRLERTRTSFVATAVRAVLGRGVGPDEPLSRAEERRVRAQVSSWKMQFNEVQLKVQCGELDTRLLAGILREFEISPELLKRGELTPSEYSAIVNQIGKRNH